MDVISKITINGSTYNIRDEETSNGLSTKQDKLNFDAEPTFGSLNPVTSGGVKQSISGFITKSVSDLVNYYEKSKLYTKDEINTLLSRVGQFSYEVVQSLPQASEETTNMIYLVPSSNQGGNNYKDEYITINEGNQYKWELIGSTNIDLSEYITTTQLESKLSEYVSNTSLSDTLSSYVQTSTLAGYVTNSALNTKLSDYATKSHVTTALSDYVTKTTLATTSQNGLMTKEDKQKLENLSSSTVQDFSKGGTMMGDLRIGINTHSPYKLYFGDGDYIWLGEPTIGGSIADDDFEIHAGSINLVADGRGGTNAARNNKVLYNGNEIAIKADIPDFTSASAVTDFTHVIVQTADGIRRITKANMISIIMGSYTYVVE